MKTLWMKLSAAASIALAACGGSSGNAAASKSFNYGAPAAPTSTESAAATTAQGNLSDTKDFSTAPSAAKGAAIIAIADSLAGLALGSAAVPGRGPSSSDMQGALRTALDYSTCTTSTTTSVTFTNCSITESGFTITLNGNISVSGDTVTWAITGGFSGSSNGATVNVTTHMSGTLTLTATTLKGSALSDFGGSVSANGQSANFGLATAVVIDVTYQTTPSVCVTSGTVEVKRVWTTRPSGATGPEFADLGVKITWTGCNAVQVAHSQ